MLMCTNRSRANQLHSLLCTPIIGNRMKRLIEWALMCNCKKCISCDDSLRSQCTRLMLVWTDGWFSVGLTSPLLARMTTTDAYYPAERKIPLPNPYISIPLSPRTYRERTRDSLSPRRAARRRPSTPSLRKNGTSSLLLPSSPPRNAVRPSSQRPRVPRLPPMVLRDVLSSSPLPISTTTRPCPTARSSSVSRMFRDSTAL
mmetsp:Transcript_35252/g.45574  ORF Transcript_35252/g.45574 Transcript_35252/m.45574 type:complete len:201 (-) Transcript_35252:585-1187(-)